MPRLLPSLGNPIRHPAEPSQVAAYRAVSRSEIRSTAYVNLLSADLLNPETRATPCRFQSTRRRCSTVSGALIQASGARLLREIGAPWDGRLSCFDSAVLSSIEIEAQAK